MGRQGLHARDLSPIIVRGTNAISTFLSDFFFFDGDGEETDSVWDVLLEIASGELYCPVSRPV